MRFNRAFFFFDKDLELFRLVNVRKSGDLLAESVEEIGSFLNDLFVGLLVLFMGNWRYV